MDGDVPMRNKCSPVWIFMIQVS